MRKQFLFCLSMTFFSFLGFAQDNKNEVEERIKPKDAPLEIHLLLTPYLEEIEKLKFYLETDGDHESYEAKFFWNKAKHSVELSKDLIIEDIEVVLKWKALSNSLKKNICTYLSAYDKHKVEKVQIQYSTDSLTNELLLDAVLKNQDVTSVNYEIVLDVKKDGKWYSVEMLFDEEGKYINERPIVKRASEFILYH